MRWASRMGKRPSVKRAEERRASAERGGRPCLHGKSKKMVSSSLSRLRQVLVLYEVCQTQRIERLFGQSWDLIVMVGKARVPR